METKEKPEMWYCKVCHYEDEYEGTEPETKEMECPNGVMIRG